MYYAENETDKYIRETYFPDFSYRGIMVEVGAGPPEWISMSKHFREEGWRCICVEPNPKFVKMHKEAGNEIYQCACSNDDKVSNFKIVNTHNWDEDKEGVSYSSLGIRYMPFDPNKNEVENIQVEVKKLNTILENVNVQHVDFVSIDTEGWEIDVMMGFDVVRYNPKVILLENYGHNSNYTTYMESLGYYLDKKIEFNYMYVKKNINYYGQHGEDKVIEKYFPGGFVGGCIDIGATDGVSISNTLHFEQNGWYCLCVEPNPKFYNNLKNNRKNALNLAVSDHNEDFATFNIVVLNNQIEDAISSLKIDDRLIKDHSQYDIKIIPITCDIRTLDYCIDNHYKYDTIDFVSVDTEGTELDVLKGFDINKWSPKLFIIENNYEDKNIEEYMNSFGYVKDQRLAVNDFYIKK